MITVKTLHSMCLNRTYPNLAAYSYNKNKESREKREILLQQESQIEKIFYKQNSQWWMYIKGFNLLTWQNDRRKVC